MREVSPSPKHKELSLYNISFLVWKMHEIAGYKCSLEDVENNDDWLGNLEMTPSEKKEFEDFATEYIYENKLYFRLFELSPLQHLATRNPIVSRRCSEVFSETILNLKKK